MTKPVDEHLTWLQFQVKQARRVHDDLVRRRDVLRLGHFVTSARELDAQVRHALHNLRAAKTALLHYTRTNRSTP